MTNHITATIEFYFKGEKISASNRLDLDALMDKHNGIPPLHVLLAQLNNIDSYSYEYEMLEAEEIVFSEPSGIAEQFFNDSQFDQTGFQQYWHEQNILRQLSPLIKQSLDIDDIQQHDDLKNIIIAAYQLGKTSVK